MMGSHAIAQFVPLQSVYHFLSLMDKQWMATSGFLSDASSPMNVSLGFRKNLAEHRRVFGRQQGMSQGEKQN